MKLSVATIVAVASASEKKVPPRHPTARLAKLNKFAAEWCTDNLNERQANHWIQKFENNTGRFQRRFELCGQYDETNTEGHGAPRERREDEDDILPKYNKDQPLVGIKQITSGFRKWAERYISACKNQPATQVARSNLWFKKLGDRYVANQEA